MGDRLGIPRVVGFPVLSLAITRDVTITHREITALTSFKSTTFLFFRQRLLNQRANKQAINRANKQAQVVSQIKSTFWSHLQWRALA